MPITDEQLEQVKAANPGKTLHVLDARPEHDDEIVVTVPTAGIWNIWQQKIVEKDISAGRVLVEACCVFPARKDLLAMLDAKPGLANTWSAELQMIGGIAKGDHRRKL
jgi:hypothetical protein